MTVRREELAGLLASLASERGVPEGAEWDLDSLALLQVITYLEKTYGIHMAELDVEPDDLRSMAGILALVERCG